MFKVGQKVICVKPFFPYHGEMIPKKGEIYTIRTVRGEWVRVEEIVNKPQWYDEGFFECDFDSAGFRPIDYTFGEQVCESLEVMTEPELA